MKNEMSQNKSNLVLWLVLLGFVFLFTIGLFFTFKPDTPHMSFWIVLSDILFMEILVGIYVTFGLSGLKKSSKDSTSLPVAMHISISAFASTIFFIGLLIDFPFLFFMTSDLSGKILLWIVLAKWLLFIGISFIMWVVGKKDY